MAYWAVPGVKQAGANLQGEHVMRHFSHCHKGLIVVWDERALKKKEKNIYH